MPLIFNVLFLLITARVLGEVASRYRQPSVVGELMAGFLLGPLGFGWLAAKGPLAAFESFTVFFILLAAGLETDWREVKQTFKLRNVPLALLGFLLPLAAGFWIAHLFGFSPVRSMVMGICISITSVLGILRTIHGSRTLTEAISRYASATAVVNNIAALALLGIILNYSKDIKLSAFVTSILPAFGKVMLFFGAALLVNYVLRLLMEKGLRAELLVERLMRVSSSDAALGIVAMFIFILIYLGKGFGMHAAVGAFFGGILVSRDLLAKQFMHVQRTVHSISSGFLLPLFFASVGMELSLSAMKPMNFIWAYWAVAVGAMLLAGWLGGRLMQLNDGRALAIGAALNARGTLTIIVAHIAYRNGFIGQGIFSAIVLLSIISIVVAPYLFKRFVLPRL